MGMQCWGRHWPDASDGSLARQTDSGLPLSLVRRGTEDAVPLTPARPLAAPTLFPGPSPLVCDSTVCRALWPPDALLRDLEVADAPQGSEMRIEDSRGAGEGERRQRGRGWCSSLPGVCGSFPGCTRSLTRTPGTSEALL